MRGGVILRDERALPEEKASRAPGRLAPWSTRRRHRRRAVDRPGARRRAVKNMSPAAARRRRARRHAPRGPMPAARRRLRPRAVAGRRRKCRRSTGLEQGRRARARGAAGAGRSRVRLLDERITNSRGSRTPWRSARRRCRGGSRPRAGEDKIALPADGPCCAVDDDSRCCVDAVRDRDSSSAASATTSTSPSRRTVVDGRVERGVIGRRPRPRRAAELLAPPTSWAGCGRRSQSR